MVTAKQIILVAINFKRIDLCAVNVQRNLNEKSLSYTFIRILKKVNKSELNLSKCSLRDIIS